MVSVPTQHDSRTIRLLDELTEDWAGVIEFVEESDSQLTDIVREHQTDRVRYTHPFRIPRVIAAVAAQSGFHIPDRPLALNSCGICGNEAFGSVITVMTIWAFVWRKKGYLSNRGSFCKFARTSE